MKKIVSIVLASLLFGGQATYAQSLSLGKKENGALLCINGSDTTKVVLEDAIIAYSSDTKTDVKKEGKPSLWKKVKKTANVTSVIGAGVVGLGSLGNSMGAISAGANVATKAASVGQVAGAADVISGGSGETKKVKLTTRGGYSLKGENSKCKGIKSEKYGLLVKAPEGYTEGFADSLIYSVIKYVPEKKKRFREFAVTTYEDGSMEKEFNYSYTDFVAIPKDYKDGLILLEIDLEPGEYSVNYILSRLPDGTLRTMTFSIPE